MRRGHIFYLLIGLVFLGASCTGANQQNKDTSGESKQNLQAGAGTEIDIDPEKVDTATFAGGCFWCVEAVFQRVNGVEDVISGYSGGNKPNPAYEEVARGQTEYAEAVQIYYDASVISYSQLLEVFFATHDPTQLNRQGPDVGKQYRTAVFYHNKKQKSAVTGYIETLNNSGKYDKEIVTKVNPYDKFYTAKEEHQNFYEKHPNHPYIQMWAVPKVEKLKKNFGDYIKSAYL